MKEGVPEVGAGAVNVERGRRGGRVREGHGLDRREESMTTTNDLM